jgi:hypothetical protein
MENNFISEDDLQTFGGFLKYQAVDPAMLTPDELAMWRGYFDEAVRRRASAPKLGLMKLSRDPGEQKYAVAIRHGDDLWLTMWVRCSPKGEVFILYPRAGREAGDPHASYHLSGIFHQKGHGKARLRHQRQPLTPSFKESEHLGIYLGHGKSSGAVCEPKAFDAVVIVEPGILGPRHGSVGIDLVAPGYEAEWARDVAERFYFGTVRRREVLSRNPRPSLVITIQQ